MLVDEHANAEAGPAVSNSDLLMVAIVLCALGTVAVLTKRMSRLER